ncbi:hypothetical protein Tco_0340034 [Tanacetum coccineum]
MDRNFGPVLATLDAFSAVGEKGKLLLSPQQVVIGDHKDTTGTMSPNTMVDPVLEIDYPHRALKNKGIVDVDVHLYRSMIGSLMYLTASRPDIMFAVCACSRFQVTPKSSHLSAVKRIFRYLKGKPKLGLWYPRVSSFDLESYSDSDYAGANLDRKSTTGGCQFLGRRLISWQCKKQTIVATSTTEAEYVAAASCCGQVLWIQNQMLDYGFNFMNTKIYIDNESTICIVKNPVYHSKTKHIAIRHHFIRDAYEKKLIQTTMAVLESCPKHNMVAYLEKTDGNAEFHEIIDFLTRSSIHHALTTDPSPTHTSEVPVEPQTDPSPTHTSEVPVEPQTDPSPRPLPSTTILDSIPEISGGNLGGHSFSDKSLSGNEGEMTLQSVYDLCLSLCAQGRKFAKGEPSVHKDPQFNEIPEDTMDYMETEDAQDVGRTRDVVDEEKENDEDALSTEDVLSTAQQKVSTDKEKVSTDRPIVSTDGSKVSTDRQKDSTDEQNKGTDDQIEGTDEQSKGTDDHTKEGSATQTTQPPTSTIFGDIEQ